MKKPGLGERFRYWFDGWMAKGTGSLVALLAIVTAGLIIVITVITFVLQALPQGQPHDFADLLWGTLVRALDSGTVAGDSGWGYRGMMMLITIAGIVIVASLISIISGAFDAKVDELRKGRSRVLENDHTLILGGSRKVFSLVSLMLSQVSENEQLTQVFGILFDSTGSEIYLRPAELYIKPGIEVNFYTVLEAARRVGETALGYRVAKNAHHADLNYGVHMNPLKGDKIAFQPGDKIIVLAEE